MAPTIGTRVLLGGLQTGHGGSGGGAGRTIGINNAYIEGLPTGVKSITAGAGITATPNPITATGTIALTSPIAASFMPAFTGDVSNPAGSTVSTLATVNANVGTWNNITINAKGLATAGSNVAYLTTAVTSITQGTGLSFSVSPITTTGSINIATGGVTNALLATMPGNTIKGNNTAGTAAPVDLTVAQTAALLGLGTISTQNANAVGITGGTVDGTSVGATTRGSGAFTTLAGNGAATFTNSLTASPANQSVTISPTGTGTVTINPATLGHIDNTAVGGTTASTGGFTTLSASGTVSGAGFTTLLAAYAPLASPTFTGTPSLPTGTSGVTQTVGNSSTALATTAYVQSQGGQLPATATNDNAAAGKVGEFIESNIPYSTPVAVVNGTAHTITSVSLTAGDWDVYGNVFINGAAGTTITNLLAGLSTVNNALPDASRYIGWLGSVVGTSLLGQTVPFLRVSVAATTSVYLVAEAFFSGSTMSVAGTLSARRAR